MTSTPFVSLILPIRNEARYVERCLNAILAQDYPVDRMEIFVVDGMSTDGTLNLVTQSAIRNPQFTILENPAHIVPTGLNRALCQAKGDIIVRVDGHCELAPDYIRRCVEHLRHEKVDVVGGPIETVGETPLAQAIASGMSSKFGVGGAAFRTIHDRAMWVDTVAFPAFTRKAIERTGLFDEELVRNQDDEYSYRLRKWGGKILLAPDVRSRYYSRSSLGSLWRQYFQYGYWKVRVLQKHPKQMSLRQFIPPLFVAALMGSLFLSVLTTPGKILFALIGGIYLLANLAASILTAARRGWQTLPLLPLVYAILHTAYGLGFLTGLVRFANRWGDKTGRVPDFRPADA